LNKPVQQITPEALALLEAYAWPGNVRELESTIKQAMLRATAPMLMVQDLPSALQRPAAVQQTIDGTAGGVRQATAASASDHLDAFLAEQLKRGGDHVFDEIVGAVKRRLLLEALERTAGNQVQAARLLGITRSTLRNELRKLDIVIDRSVNS
jgi:two-component system nitrogen regulation response regulator GlnG